MAKGIETEGENGKLVPDEDFEYEKKLAEEERKKREAEEEKIRRAEEEKARRKREAERARERQIAQDRLDLMKMKQGIADESETIEEVHETYEQPTGIKKLQNIWYHDKTWIILGFFIVAIISFITIDTILRVKPDVELLLICDNSLQSDSCCNLLAQRIEKYTPDLNGDGKVKVSVISCAMNSEKYDQIYAINSQKFFANIQEGEIIMVIADSEVAEDVNDIFTPDLPNEIPNNRYVDEKGLSLNFGFLADELQCPGMPNDVYLRLRFPMKTFGDSEEKMQKNYDICLEIVKAMAADLQAEADSTGDKGLPDRETAARIAEEAYAASWEE